MRCRRCKSRPSTLCRHTGRYRQQQDSHESDRQTQVHDLRRRSLIIRRFTTRRGCRYFTTIRRSGPDDELIPVCRCLMGMARLDWREQRLRPSVAARQRTAKRRSEYFCRIDASAFAAVLCGLLFAFLAATPLPHSGVSVDLAKSKHFRRLPGAHREDALRVTVTRDERFYLGDQGVAPEELPGWIRDGIGAGAENRVYIVADARVRYFDVKMVLDQIRAARVENVSFLTLPVPSRRSGSEPIPPELSEPKGPLHWSSPGPWLLPRKFTLAFPHTPDVL